MRLVPRSGQNPLVHLSSQSKRPNCRQLLEVLLSQGNITLRARHSNPVMNYHLLGLKQGQGLTLGLQIITLESPTTILRNKPSPGVALVQKDQPCPLLPAQGLKIDELIPQLRTEPMSHFRMLSHPRSSQSGPEACSGDQANRPIIHQQKQQPLCLLFQGFLAKNSRMWTQYELLKHTLICSRS